MAHIPPFNNPGVPIINSSSREKYVSLGMDEKGSEIMARLVAVQAINPGVVTIIAEATAAVVLDALVRAGVLPSQEAASQEAPPNVKVEEPCIAATSSPLASQD